MHVAEVSRKDTSGQERAAHGILGEAEIGSLPSFHKTRFLKIIY